MMGSKLAMPVLGKIWDLSDVDRDGMLDQYEFTVAMHLVYRLVLYTLETGYKKTGYKNNLDIRIIIPRTKSCNLSTVWIAYENKPDIRPFHFPLG